MTKKEVIEECKQRLGFDTDYEMYSLCKYEREFYNAIVEALEQETVSKEVYDSEHFARKEAEYELWKIKKQQPSEDCVSRQAVLDKKELIELPDGQSFYSIDPKDVEALLSVTPTHGTCKDCESWDKEYHFCSMLDCDTGKDFYCKDFEKRGDSDGSN